MPQTDNLALMTAPRRSFAGRIVRWVFALILTLVLIAGATLVAAFWFEQSTLRPLLEVVVTQVTGRALSIEGYLDARAGRIVTVRAGRIRLANADWGSNDDMLLVEGVEVSVDLLPLLDGILAIDNVVITSGKLLFEQDEQGRSNWAMGSGDDQSPARAADLDELQLLIARGELSDIDITVKSPDLTRPLDIHLESVVHKAERGDELSTIVIGAVENRPVNLQVRIGPLKQLLANREVDFDFKADFDAFTIGANGRLDNVLAPRQLTVHIVLESPDAMQISSMFALPESVSGAVDIDVRMVPTGDHHTVDIGGSIGALNLNAHARLKALDSIDGSAIKLMVEGPDLASAAKLAGLNGLPSKPFRFESSVELSGKHLQIGETRFDTGDNHLTIKGAMSQFPKLEGTNLNLQLHGKNYLEFAELLGLAGITGLKPAPFKVQGDLEYSARDQQKFNAQLTLGSISGELGGKLTEYPLFIGSHLNYRLDGPNSAEILRLLDRPLLIEGSYTLQGDVKRTRAGYSIERATLSFGANELDISGVIGEDPLRRDSKLSVRYRGPDLGKIAAIAGYTGFVPGGVAEITVDARVQPDGIHLDSLDARLGRTTLKGSGLISLQADLAGSRVSVAVAGEDIAEVLPADLLTYVDAQQSFDLTGTLSSSTGQIAIDTLDARLGEVRLRASGTVSIEHPRTNTLMTVDVNGPNLAAIIPERLVPYALPQAEFSVSGGVALDQNGLVLDGVKVTIGADRLELSGTIPLDTPVDGLELTVAAQGSNLDQFVPIEFDQFDIKDVPFKIGGKIQLAERILSVKQLIFSAPRGSMTGELSVDLEDPRKFGRFDLKASGDDLDAFSPTMPWYRPAAVPFDLIARGSWDTKEVSIDRGILELDDTRIEVQGKVDLPPNMTATRLVLSARGDSFADLGQIQGLVLPPDEFHIDALLQGNTQSLVLPKLNARVGESDLAGSFSIEFADKPNIKIALRSKVLDLAKFLPPEDDSVEVVPPPSPSTNDDRIIPLLPVPVDWLHSVNMATSIDVGELRLPNHILRNVDIDLSLQEGKFTVKQIKATATEGELVARFRVVANGDRIVTNGTLEGIDIVLGKGEAGEGGNLLPEQNFYLEFETEGSTSRELAGNLNGYAQLTGDEGQLKNSVTLGLYSSFFKELVGTVNPFVKREPYTTISCFAAYAEIVDGVASINPGAVLQTDKLDMFARGQIDLKTERINLRFDTNARKGIGISASDFVNPFVGVGGTLARPRLGLDPKNAMFEGGIAYATGGLSIIAKSLYGRWFGTKDPCAKFEKKAEEYLRSNKAGRHREQDP